MVCADPDAGYVYYTGSGGLLVMSTYTRSNRLPVLVN